MEKEVSKKLLEILACPACKGNLDYKKKDNLLKCIECSNKYKIKNGIPVMLVPK